MSRELIKRLPPVYLFLAPLSFPLAMLAAHPELASRVLSPRFVLLVWTLVGAAWIGLSTLLKNSRRAGALVLVLVVAFYVDLMTGDVTPIPVAWLGALAASAWFIRSRRDPKRVTVYANVFFAVLSAMLFAQFAIGWRTVVASSRIWPTAAAPIPALGTTSGTRPDVYVFVLDGYGRADVLERLYGYDDPLVPRLRRDGFVVADAATSNYGQTGLSLGSSLNLEYLPALLDPLPSDSDSRLPCQRLIADNEMFRTFKRAGYRIVTFASEDAMFSFPGADVSYAPLVRTTEFEDSFFAYGAVARLSKLAGFPPAWVAHQLRRRQVEWTFARLARGVIAESDRPTLVFVHILLPHPPFSFRPDGGYRATRVSGMFDGDHWRTLAEGTGESYQAGYAANLGFLANQLPAVIEHILAGSRRPVAMLIEGDHGPGSHLAWENPAASDLAERFSILMAARFPDPTSQPLYPTVTSVNAARLLVGNVLGMRLPPLEDRSYFSTWSAPYQFLDVTARVSTRPGASQVTN